MRGRHTANLMAIGTNAIGVVSSYFVHVILDTIQLFPSLGSVRVTG